MRIRKTDKCRLKEGRGLGIGSQYIPWIKVHEFGSNGRVSRVKGWKTGRVAHLMSDLEHKCFLNEQFDDQVIDIREQYPLLPLEQTKSIADKLEVIHPPKSRKQKTVMTTDFLITLKGAPIKYKAIAVKPKEGLEDARIAQKLAIEAEYWRLKEIPFEIVTEDEIDEVLAKNLEIMYKDYWWLEKMAYLPETIDGLVNQFKQLMVDQNMTPVEAAKYIGALQKWDKYEYVNFLHYLIVTKRIAVDLSKPLDLNKLEFITELT